MISKLTPCLVMDGRATEAIELYRKAMGAEILQIQTYGEMPMPCPDAMKDRVANAVLKLGSSELMLFDSPGHPVQTGNNVVISVSSSDVQTTRQMFETLMQDGEVIAPLEEVPFSPAFGTVTDKFGVTFMIVTEVKS